MWLGLVVVSAVTGTVMANYEFGCAHVICSHCSMFFSSLQHYKDPADTPNQE